MAGLLAARKLRMAGGMPQSEETTALAGGDEQRETQPRAGVDVDDARRMCPNSNDLKWVDQFPYIPSYKFHPYRSVTGATCSVLLGFIFFCVPSETRSSSLAISAV